MSNRFLYTKMLDRIIECSGPKFPITLLELEFLSDAIAADTTLSDFGKVNEAQKCINILEDAGLWHDGLCARFFMLHCIGADCKRDMYCGPRCKQFRKG